MPRRSSPPPSADSKPRRATVTGQGRQRFHSCGRAGLPKIYLFDNKFADHDAQRHFGTDAPDPIKRLQTKQEVFTPITNSELRLRRRVAVRHLARQPSSGRGNHLEAQHRHVGHRFGAATGTARASAGESRITACDIEDAGARDRCHFGTFPHRASERVQRDLLNSLTHPKADCNHVNGHQGWATSPHQPRR